MSLRPSVFRLGKTLTKAQQLLLSATADRTGTCGLEGEKRDEFLKYIRRLGALVSSVELQMNALDDDDGKDEAVAQLVFAAKKFLSDVLLSAHGRQGGIPLSCVGLLCREQSPRHPFAASEPFLVQEDPRGMSEAACVFPCMYHHHNEASKPQEISTYVRLNDANAHAHSVPTANGEEAAHAKVMEDIREAIKGMKEGVTRMSDMMQQERLRLDANAELLRRGVDGTSTQSRRMDQLGYAFGGGPSLPRCLSSIPAAKLFWQTVVVPMWVIIRQAIFLLIIVAITCSVLLLMITAPKTYIYVR
ncbi:hypothetical protein MOQ_001713 [Trypanosoma cruzi marinkellei]|uniref:Uncharacterized protein n=1 Tax=Trypanosoma cruzi marinkellei TaxID=85056 RepID=K2PAI9_TRYCR|nr:hypothetical protein MOQ_001713 [Trypanosoma cruzi marinkellei]